MGAPEAHAHIALMYARDEAIKLKSKRGMFLKAAPATRIYANSLPTSDACDNWRRALRLVPYHHAPKAGFTKYESTNHGDDDDDDVDSRSKFKVSFLFHYQGTIL